ncbi:hypothetical protein NP233_g2102 [Leucocoprinus birnbaumii]|uniref:CxC2-like cysteine cluster KDZ transposase-associated domain-containing protein n=1 Tax=Leucocoprinus birnbaumii TaxID=56174 RepID=A0AAD5VZK6_9AGAR|nr:hypothetical protein NP233_g2102 [Leucocoprinus birnbaumii]
MAQKRKNPHVYKEDDKPSSSDPPVQVENIRLVQASKTKKTRHRIIKDIIPTEKNASTSSSSFAELLSQPLSPDITNKEPEAPMGEIKIADSGNAVQNPHGVEELFGDEKNPPRSRHRIHTIQKAFTFSALASFHQLSLCSKITAYDYYDSLKKLTNHAFPQRVEDRYKELMAIMRIWRTLVEDRCSGQVVSIGIEFPLREPGSIALRCPACPEPGFNVSLDVLANAPPELKHTLTLFLALDGNFRLNQKFKNGDRNDVPLNKGKAYFVNNVAFEEYLKLHDDGATQNSTCSKLKAVRQQQMIKFSDMVYSGVVATQCRHGTYVRSGMVNLVRGETYVRSDYALASALSFEGSHQRWVMLSYDIWCQFSINLLDRMRTRFPHLVPVFERLRGAIPKMHIYGHGEHCQLTHSFSYTKYSGMTCGESIESAWSEQNHAAGSTKEQSTGHRQDTLDDFNNYWNWTKIHRMSKYLLTQLTKYWDELQEQNEVFAKLTARFSNDVLKGWEEMWVIAEEKADKEMDLKGKEEAKKSQGVAKKNGKRSRGRGKRKGVAKNKEYSVFQASGVKVPSRRDPPVELPEDADSESGSDSEEPDSPSRDLSDLVEEGIEIQYLQCTIQGQVKNKNHNIQAIAESRRDLRSAIESWRNELRKIYPTLRPLGLSDYPENDTIELPSSYTIPEIHEYKIADFAQLEFTVRLGIAYDTIDDIRTTIHIYNASKLVKRTEVFGQGPATRAWTILNGLKNDIRECAKRYQQSYHGLCRLGLPQSSELKPVTEQDLWGKDMSSTKKKGDSKQEEPWFWVIGKPSDISDDQWKLELDRVRWFRTRAFRDRLQEEVEILCAEFQRVVYSFSRMDIIWRISGDRKASGETDESLANGYRAFAYQQADVYRLLAEDSYSHWLEAQSYMSKPYIPKFLTGSEAVRNGYIYLKWLNIALNGFHPF